MARFCHCGRHAYIGSAHCCRTCATSGGTRHGPTCEELERNRHLVQGTGMCRINCGRRAAEGFESCCQSCTMSEGRQHGPQCEALHRSSNPGAAAAAALPAAPVNITGHHGTPCSNACGRIAASKQFSTCCRECSHFTPVGSRHGRLCDAAHRAQQQQQAAAVGPAQGAPQAAQPQLAAVHSGPVGAQAAQQVIDVINLQQFVSWRSSHPGPIAHIKGFGNGMSSVYNADALRELGSYKILAWDGDPPADDGFTALIPKFLAERDDRYAVAFKMADGIPKLQQKWRPILAAHGSCLTVVSISPADLGQVQHEMSRVASLPENAQRFYALGRVALRTTGAMQVISLGGGGIAGHEADASLQEGVRWIIYALSRGSKEKFPSLMDWAVGKQNANLVFIFDGRDPSFANAFAGNAPAPFAAASQPALGSVSSFQALASSSLPQAQAAPQMMACGVSSYCICLLPRISKATSKILARADMQQQQEQGSLGLHVSLCGWAGNNQVAGHNGKAHGTDLLRLAERMRDAAIEKSNHRPSQLFHTNPLRDSGDDHNLSLDLGNELWLVALANTAREGNLQGAPPGGLHILLGPRSMFSPEIEQARIELRECREWRVCVMKFDGAGQVTESEHASYRLG